MLVIHYGFYETKNVEHKREFVGEETTAAFGTTELTDEPTWIVDPLYGTTNFVHGLKRMASERFMSSMKEVGELHLFSHILFIRLCLFFVCYSSLILCGSITGEEEGVQRIILFLCTYMFISTYICYTSSFNSLKYFHSLIAYLLLLSSPAKL
ncbi:PREDICTED: uncharacterized protein LOC105973481 [Erythranthe guttata]|uniref:uncharacterized protein LOC105973481 n=1 Tax=Erythranthe guttata TaxID=4155 RepID=UPI00064DB051|nr:PREDICTED: uncharacterized protein LOC105973481 [Erythranthe guttata]XP_012853964.1 PREDICTED: uncharacterized protein LOC105973481 [Erythranthe guttata]XP_012853965.1 PREDICTED: uncharacterized protein LOC105973481 [Erythranthe guttata]|eukprot:XP_012853962.1 PREDICTED: uncharacterized protein LOC105973481 [Erythranthe guttata]